jgi:two-component system, chemotaxis family, protein-glutamate methylesterase/glutaminase
MARSAARVMVVDDSVVVRRMLTKALEGAPDLELVGTAVNGKMALAKLDALAPDAVVLDVEMPEMDGLATLTELRRRRPRLPVIMFSTLTARGAATTLDALSRGASDYVTKPVTVGATETIAQIRDELVPRLLALTGRSPQPGRVDLPRPATGRTAPASLAGRLGPAAATLTRPTRVAPVDVVVIGVSTGGPTALEQVIPALPGELDVPVLVVQHMPPMFTHLLAERLDARSPLSVSEAVTGDAVSPGRVLIAPGGFHMVPVADRASAIGARRPTAHVVLNEDPPEHSCRPAVDPMFRAAVSVWGAGVLAVVLTGMGQDGRAGARLVAQSGGRVIAQDEATSVVWGMPGFVAQDGTADAVLPVDQVAEAISNRVRAGHGRPLTTARTA